MSNVRKLDDYFTYADYCTWPDDERWELIDGVAYAQAAQSEMHQTIAWELTRQLGAFLRGNPCKAFYAPFSVRLSADTADDTVVEPDILVVCDEKKLEGGKGVIGAPDLIIEILSPSSARHDRVTKFKLYMRSGVREYWIVNPDEKTLMANVLRDGRYMTLLYFEHDTEVPVEVLDGCVINLAEVFENE